MEPVYVALSNIVVFNAERLQFIAIYLAVTIIANLVFVLFQASSTSATVSLALHIFA